MNPQIFINLIVAFAKEILKRYPQKSPLFFKVITYISAAVSVVTGLPDFLTKFNITLPTNLTVLENKTVACCALTAAVIAKLTVDRSPVSVNEQGDILPNQVQLPFTAKTEGAALDKALANQNPLNK